MEIVAILATLLVAVLQIITLSLIKSTNKKVDELAAQKSNLAHNDRDRNNRDFRQQQNNRRPGTDSKQQKPQNQPVAPSGPSTVDQVEKSLRDINLKLKNAERDQENARKKIQTNYPKDQSFKRQENRDSREGRDNRDGRDGGSRGGRDNRNRGDRRNGNNWQDRSNRRDSNNPGNQVEFNRSSDQSVSPEKSFSAEENTTVNQVNAAESVSLQQSTPAIEPSDFTNDDSLQHGRKVSVKRRMLKEEDSVIENADSENSENVTSKNNESSSNETDQNQQDSSADSEIKFGRR
jgi:hypothetical protein